MNFFLHIPYDISGACIYCFISCQKYVVGMNPGEWWHELQQHCRDNFSYFLYNHLLGSLMQYHVTNHHKPQDYICYMLITTSYHFTTLCKIIISSCLINIHVGTISMPLSLAQIDICVCVYVRGIRVRPSFYLFKFWHNFWTVGFERFQRLRLMPTRSLTLGSISIVESAQIKLLRNCVTTCIKMWSPWDRSLYI